MSYSFFKENIRNITSREFCDFKFSENIINAIKDRIFEYSNRNNVDELSKAISNFDSVNFEMKDREENDNKEILINKIKTKLEEFKNEKLLFSYYIDLNYKNSYRNLLYICENAFEEINSILDNYKELGVFKPSEKLLYIFYDLNKTIESSSTHLAYITGTNKVINTFNIDIVKVVDDLMCPFVYTTGINYKNVPFSKEDVEEDIYDILFDTISIIKNIFSNSFNSKVNDIAKKLLEVENSFDNERFLNISYVIFALYDIISNIALDYIEDIQSVVYEFYNSIGSYENNYEVNDNYIVSEKYMQTKLLDKINFIKEYRNVDFSKEAINTIDEAGHTENNISLNDVDETYKSKWLKLQKTLNEIFKIKIGKLNLKIGAAFFKKWYGRIPSMYSRYGGEASIPENNMKDDPVNILTTSGVEYLNKLADESEVLFNDLIIACKKVTSAGNLAAKVNVVKDYCKQYPIEEGVNSDPKTIERQIKNETCFRIAKAIMQENNVYGYSVNGIVENGKFPTCNHIVVSLFIDNPHEKPGSISVSSIFSSPESLLIFAKPEKLYVVETTYRRSMSKILNNFNHKTTSVVVKNMNKNYKMFTSNLVKQANIGAGMTPNEENGNGEDIKQAKKVAKAIEKGLTGALDIVIEQKRRCIQCIGVMYDMMNRIQKLAKRCVAAMHEIEVSKSDTNFKSGINSGSLNRSVRSASKQVQANRNIEQNSEI